MLGHRDQPLLLGPVLILNHTFTGIIKWAGLNWPLSLGVICSHRVTKIFQTLSPCTILFLRPSALLNSKATTTDLTLLAGECSHSHSFFLFLIITQGHVSIEFL